MRFRVGDICQIRHLDDIDATYRGRECTVLTGLLNRIELQGFERWRVYASPHVLKPLPPPYTKLSGWMECPWRPAIKNATTNRRGHASTS